MKPSVSVIVPVLNREKTVKECVNSLLRQSYPKELYEIIVIDNGSTDCTYTKLKEFEEKIVLLTCSKKGSYAARHKGIEASKGKILCFIDGDCKADNQWLKEITQPFSQKEVAVVGGKVKAWKVNNTIQRYCDIFWNPQEKSAKSHNPYVSNCNMAIRRTAYKKVRGYNQSLLSGGDVDLCNRIHHKKGSLQYEKKAVVYNNYPPSLWTFIKKQIFYGKWEGKRKGPRPMVKIGTIKEIYQQYGIKYGILRLIHSLSYRIGRFSG